MRRYIVLRFKCYLTKEAQCVLPKALVSVLSLSRAVAHIVQCISYKKVARCVPPKALFFGATQRCVIYRQMI